MQNNYIIYMLTNTSHNKTYIGITNNMRRRIRQHNREITGGAKYTTANIGFGEWIYHGWIASKESILEKNRALSIEKKIKIRSKKIKGIPLERRIKAIDSLLLENIDLEFKKNSDNII
jgi:predicted GIY-YIG superfamily endonuclease